ncbi:MAG: hypothetical protein KDB53_05745 [Planctomycetes bacterium]|nr:hypothetical protein [Planctomycetota bacterium]
MSDSTNESLALEFQERFWADHDAGGIKPLAAYLELFSGHHELIATESVAAIAELHGTRASTSHDEAPADRVGSQASRSVSVGGDAPGRFTLSGAIPR